LIGAIIEGVICGVLLSVLLGPVFFMLIETSIRKGVKSAISLDLGVLFSDLIYVYIAYSLTSRLRSLLEGNTEIISIIGGIIFLIFGIFSFISKGTVPPKKIKPRNPAIKSSNGHIVQFFKGLLLNLFNPALPFYWIGVVGFASEQFPDNQVTFLCTIIMSYFTFDVLKIFGARKLKPFITPKRMSRIKQLTAIVFICAGVYLLIKGVGWLS